MSIFNVTQFSDEEWRPIAGFEGYYEVSSLGRVRSVNRTLSNGAFVKGRLIEPAKWNYSAVSLYRENKGHNKLVHRLVAEAFLPNPNNLPEVNHKDNNIRNNVVSNLEWVSASSNSVQRVNNRSNGNRYSRNVVCLDTGQVFNSISAAGRSVGADATQVIESIRMQRCCKGYVFAYADEVPADIEKYIAKAHQFYQSFHRRPTMPNCRKVEAIETSQVFDSIASAARFFSCDTATISNRIKAAKPFNGITLRFVEETKE